MDGYLTAELRLALDFAGTFVFALSGGSVRDMLTAEIPTVLCAELHAATTVCFGLHLASTWRGWSLPGVRSARLPSDANNARSGDQPPPP